MWGKDGKCHICIPQHGSKFGTYHLCPFFTPQLCYNFATYLPREFVQIHFFVQWRILHMPLRYVQKRSKSPSRIEEKVSTESCTLDLFNTDT